MGQQLSITAQTAPSIAISSYVDIIKDVHYLSQLNSSRFLKTCKALDRHGEIIVKIFLKTDPLPLKHILEEVAADAIKLQDLPNVLHYATVFETERAGYLIRQHMNSNLYNRLCSRPFFKTVELKFLCFQLLNILDSVHSRGCLHGDIKLENLLITSGNWVMLTDFSKNIKPVFIPEDNPNEYSFYFNTSQRTACYLAPERFNNKKLNRSSDEFAGLTKEMDIFSAGCCIFEIFKEASKPLFTFSEIFKYKNNELDIRLKLSQEFPNDRYICDLIMDMVDLYSEKRLSASDLLDKYKNKLFPGYFYSVMYTTVQQLVTYESEFSSAFGKPISDRINTEPDTSLHKEFSSLQATTESVFYFFWKNLETVCLSMHYPMNKSSVAEHLSIDAPFVKMYSATVLQLQKFDSLKAKEQSVADQSALSIIAVLTSFLRTLKTAQSQVYCMDTLIVLSQYIDDGSKIDNVLPYFIMMLSSKNSEVQVVALQKCLLLLGLLSHIDQDNESLLIDYVLPKFRSLLQNMKHDVYGKIMFAQSMSALTKVIFSFQDLVIENHLSSDNEFDEEMLNFNSKVLKYMELLTVAFLTDENTHVRIAFLKNIAPICRLFGKERSSDIILSHLITYLNDKSANLRVQFIETISNIAVLLGTISFEQYILPLMIQALTDSEESVAMTTLKTLFSMIKIGLLKAQYFADTCANVAPLVLHPNENIRQFSLSIIVCVMTKMRTSEKYCILYPIIKPYFDFELEMTPELMTLSVKKALPRKIYSIFYTWCLNFSNSLFWKKKTQDNHVDVFGNNFVEFVTRDYLTKTYGFRGSNLPKDMLLSNDHVSMDVPLSVEDKNWMDKLRKAGLREDDTWKLAVLRTYVYKVAKMSPRKPFEKGFKNEPLELEHILTERKIMPRNVFLKINYLPEYRKETLHIISKPKNITVSQPSAVIDSNISTNESNIAQIPPKAISSNGSLFLASKAKPTRVSNFDNVYVQLESSSSLSVADVDSIILKEAVKTKYTVSSSYEGSSEPIKRFIKTVSVSPSITSLKEFGTFMDSTDSSKQENASKLQGIHTACIAEKDNNGASTVTAVACSLFTPHMIIGTDTGRIEIYDVQQLQENQTFSSLFHFDVKQEITGIAFLQQFNVFVVATKEGKIMVYKFETNKGKEKLTINNVKIVSVYDFDNEKEFGIAIQTMGGANLNYFFVLSNKGNIIEFDVKTMKPLLAYTNERKHGAVTSFTVARNKDWMVIGTIKGILTLWDIRLNCVIKMWCFGDCTPIHDLFEYSSYNEQRNLDERRVLVVGGSSNCTASLWDLSKLQCKMVIAKNMAENAIKIDDFVAKDVAPNSAGPSLDALQLNAFVLQAVKDDILIWDGNKKDITTVSLLNGVASGRVLVGTEKNDESFKVTKITSVLSIVERLKTSATEKHSKRIVSGNNVEFLRVLHTAQGLPILVTISNRGRIDVYS
ncbi:hypothetical protein ACO0QE_003302 [Hanseniaspora vineae]